MSVLEARRTTLFEYYILHRSWELRSLDERQMLSYLAWQTAIAGSTDKSGKPVCRKFKDLFDYEKELRNIYEEPKENISEHEKSAIERIKNLNRNEVSK